VCPERKSYCRPHSILSTAAQYSAILPALSLEWLKNCAYFKWTKCQPRKPNVSLWQPNLGHVYLMSATMKLCSVRLSFQSTILYFSFVYSFHGVIIDLYQTAIILWLYSAMKTLAPGLAVSTRDEQEWLFNPIPNGSFPFPGLACFHTHSRLLFPFSPTPIPNTAKTNRYVPTKRNKKVIIKIIMDLFPTPNLKVFLSCRPISSSTYWQVS